MDLSTQSPLARLSRSALTGALALAVSGCSMSHGLFSDVPMPDRSRPVARVETLGGSELAATTSEGILMLGRTAKSGPCRIQYLLGPTPIVEDGEIQHKGGVLYEAVMDLKHQAAPVLDRSLRADDDIVAMVMDGFSVDEYWTNLASDPDVVGDVLDWPGDVPAGTPIFVVKGEQPHFAGLITGTIVYTPAGGSPRRLTTFAGFDRLREAWLTPDRHPKPRKVIHRADDITVVK